MAKANNEISPVVRAFRSTPFVSHFGVLTMNTSLRVPGMLSAALIASALLLGGCSGMNRQEKNTATGAVIGGVVGNVLCGGLACTGAGAAVGGVIGHEVDKH
jgi:osmotically inducible lipoprotein OsmB